MLMKMGVVMSANLVSKDTFKKYWEILKRNYQDKTHNITDFNLYYSIFKEFEEKDFINAIKQVLLNNKYFPRIDEIAQYLPQNDTKLPEWFNKDLNEKTNITKTEKEELEKIIKELSEVEYEY